MKQRLFQNMLKAAGAFLFAVTMSAGFTACIVENDNPVPDGISDIERSIKYLKSII